MDFSWARAVQVALVGFAGVFVILFILQISVSITGRVVQKLEKKPVNPLPEKTAVK